MYYPCEKTSTGSQIEDDYILIHGCINKGTPSELFLIFGRYF